MGKTELARALAEFLFDDERAMVRIDMSEYMEKHAVPASWAPRPGYVGYDEGGQLTEAVRRRPYSVVLLDEIEKAHPDVFNILLQVLEDGRLTDGQGRTVDFTNTVLIMTSNLRATRATTSSRSSSTVSTRSSRFRPLTEDDLAIIVGIQLARLRPRLAERRLSWWSRPEAEQWLAHAGYDPDYGARPLRRVLQRAIEDPLALALLEGKYLEGATVTVDAVPAPGAGPAPTCRRPGHWSCADRRPVAGPCLAPARTAQAEHGEVVRVDRKPELRATVSARPLNSSSGASRVAPHASQMKWAWAMEASW